MLRRIPVALLLIFALLASEAHAQSSGNTALGVELGYPSGVTLLLNAQNRTAYEFVAAWDLDRFLFVNGHMLWKAQETVDPGIFFRYGPGAFIGIRDHHNRGNDFVDDELLAGVSFRGEAVYGWDRFEVYLALTPRFALIESTEFGFGGAFGFRLFL